MCLLLQAGLSLAEFAALRQRQNEFVHEFVNRMMEAEMSCEFRSNADRESQKLEVIMEGLRHPMVKLKMRERMPRSFTEAAELMCSGVAEESFMVRSPAYASESRVTSPGNAQVSRDVPIVDL